MRSEGKKGLVPLKEPPTIQIMLDAFQKVKEKSIVSSPSKTTVTLMNQIIPTLEQEYLNMPLLKQHNDKPSNK
jgi:molybdopterin-guanine dinucleotide biosynthesis protein A